MKSSLKSKSGKLIFCAAVAGLALTLAVRAQAQSFTLLASFNGADGYSPNAVVQGTDGNFYGSLGEERSGTEMFSA
jgi:hypothetical protein